MSNRTQKMFIRLGLQPPKRKGISNNAGREKPQTGTNPNLVRQIYDEDALSTVRSFKDDELHMLNDDWIASNMHLIGETKCRNWLQAQKARENPSQCHSRTSREEDHDRPSEPLSSITSSSPVTKMALQKSVSDKQSTTKRKVEDSPVNLSPASKLPTRRVLFASVENLKESGEVGRVLNFDEKEVKVSKPASFQKLHLSDKQERSMQESESQHTSERNSVTIIASTGTQRDATFQTPVQRNQSVSVTVSKPLNNIACEAYGTSSVEDEGENSFLKISMSSCDKAVSSAKENKSPENVKACQSSTSASPTPKNNVDLQPIEQNKRALYNALRRSFIKENGKFFKEATGLEWNVTTDDLDRLHNDLNEEERAADSSDSEYVINSSASSTSSEDTRTATKRGQSSKKKAQKKSTKHNDANTDARRGLNVSKQTTKTDKQLMVAAAVQGKIQANRKRSLIPPSDNQGTCQNVEAEQIPDPGAPKPAEVADESDSAKEAATPEIQQDSVPEVISQPLGTESQALSDDDLDAHLAEGPAKPASTKQIRNENKALRNAGKTYFTAKGKKIAPRKRQEIHECKHNKCIEKISPETGDKLFNEFWEDLANRDEQAKYVAARITTKPIQRRRQRDSDSNKTRTATYEYSFEINGERVKVCKDTFLGTLNVSETFVRFIMEKKAKSLSGIIPPDARGRHAPKHKLKQSTELAIKRHIDSFPVYVSHYSRTQTKVLYFPSHLKIVRMHNLYLENPENPPISYSVYRKFVKKTGKKFRKPQGDTCNTCESLKLKIEVSEGPLKRLHEVELERHKRKADLAYAIKRQMKAKSQEDKKMRVLVFDLEQCLPTPMLTCKQVYYSRQLYVYNLTIYDATTKITYCYMWHEAQGAKGANQVASCVLRHIREEIPHDIEEIVLFSDSCSGQNRNSHIAAMYFVALQEHPSLKKIEHIFLVPGHTHLEVDNKHSLIERKKREKEKISVPEEWYQLVKEAGMTDPKKFPEGKFKVIRMEQTFLDFAALMNKDAYLIKREKLINGEKMSYLDSHWFVYKKEQIGIVEVKEALNPDALFEKLSFLRQGHRSDSLPRLLPTVKLCYDGPYPISVKKKKDLIELLDYLHPQHHAFYMSLVTDASIIEDIHPSIPEVIDEEMVEDVVGDVLEFVLQAVTENMLGDEDIDI